jgi:integrase
VNPIPQVRRRPAPVDAGWAGRGSQDEQRPATYSHDAVREKVEWLPPAEYRRWREMGIRGFDAAGMPAPTFRGRWAARNASFCDLMVRTGLRLSEQAALTVFEVPADRAGGGYRRFWLPNSIAKGGSGRWVYVPVSVLGDLVDYTGVDRRAVIARAQAEDRYRRWPRPMIAGDPARSVVSQLVGGVRRRVKIADLDAGERTRVLMEGPDGLEPVAFWLGEHGQPLSVSAWKGMFRDANSRCAAAGVEARCHTHLLRHTFAVLTLEQLQRGHIAALGELSVDQRGHYTRVFGDPLDWVRRRLGHRSVVTTQIYLHALAELEMQTRMMLIPDDWEDPRDDQVTLRPVGPSGDV